MMGQAVEQGAGEPLGSEYAGPFIKRQIAGDEGRSPFVTLAEDLEQQLGAGLRQRHVSEFVDDQQLVGGVLTLQSQQPFLIARLQQFMDESCGSVEANRQPFLAGRETEPETDVRLAGAARSSDILPGIRATGRFIIRFTAMWGDGGCRSASAFPTWRRFCRPSTRWNTGAYSMLDDERRCGSS